MVGTSNQIDIVIQSIFNSKGVRDAKTQFDKLSQVSSKASKKLRGMRNIDNIIASDKKLKKYRSELEAVNLELGQHGEILKRNQKGQFESVSPREAADKIKEYRESQESLKKLREEEKKQQQEIERIRDSMPSMSRAFKEGSRIGRNQIEKLGNGLRKAGQEFNMAALSALFFGMQVMNVSTRIAKSSIAAFTDIADSSNDSVQGINQLKAGFKTLKFAIGEALAGELTKLLPTILQIIEGLVNWIDKNPELIASLVKWTGVIGSALFVIGTLKLAIGGVIDTIGGMIVGIGSAISWFQKTDSAADAATSGIMSFKGALRAVGLAAGVALGVKFTVDSWKILSEDGTTIGEYAKIVGESTIAGALIGSFFGPTGAAIGAAAGFTIGVIVSAIDFILEPTSKEVRDQIRTDIESSYTATNIELNKSIPVSGTFDPEIGTRVVTGDTAGEISKVLSDMGLETKRFVNTTVDDMGNVSFELNKLGKEFQNAFQSGVSEEQLKSQFKSVQESTKKTTESAKKMNQEFQESFANIAETKNAEQIDKLKESVVKFSEKVGELNIDNFLKISQAMKNIDKSLSGGGENEGLISSLEMTISKISGKENSITTALDLWIVKMIEAKTTISETLVPEVNNAKSALEDNAVAAENAASAQERYNKAVNGAF